MSETLHALIRERIQTQGPITFREFMELALYHPEHGYYSSGRATIGRGGDFYTSVSVGPIFGRLLARQFAEMWQSLGGPADFTVVEQGAHGGDFARDVLGALKVQAPDCFSATRYQIIEPSASLRERQQTTLAEFTERVTWAASLQEVSPWTGVHFSNELMDAFPVHRVRWTGSEWRELYVAEADGEFLYEEGPLTDSEALRERLKTIPVPLPTSYEIEINLAVGSWLAEVSARLSKGWLIAIDYGHPRPEFYRADRKGGTIAAYRQHRRVDNPLQTPGEMDLTAHVEFTSVAEQAENYGFRLCGFTDQHHFMVGLSRLHFTDAAGQLSAEQERDLRGFKTLMHPGLMGLSFKVLGLSKGLPDSQPLSGFAFGRNPRGELGMQ
ncbi:class I SAM-dependent methyltransferase [Verrucomicrobiota bacterium sgz303538]